MDKMRRFWVGTDPGGKGAFGLAFVDLSGAVRCETVSSVDEAVKAITAVGKPFGLGIDAPMWWSAGEGAGPQGRRETARALRHPKRDRPVRQFVARRRAHRRGAARLPAPGSIPCASHHGIPPQGTTACTASR